MDTLSCGLLTVCCCVFSTAAEVHRQTVDAGDDVLLQCQSLQKDVTLVEWIRPDLKADGYVFFYRERRSYENYQHPHYRGRVTLGDPRMENGNMSVLLTNVQPDKDNGTYLCCVSGRTKGRERTTSSEINLIVSPAKPGNTQKLMGNGGHMDGGHMDGGHMDGGHMDGGHMDGGHMDGGHMDGGHMDGSNRRRNGLIVFLSLSVAVAFLVFVAIHKEHIQISKEQKQNPVPPDDPV